MHRVLLAGSALFLVTLAVFLIVNYEDVDERTGMPRAEGVAGQRDPVPSLQTTDSPRADPKVEAPPPEKLKTAVPEGGTPGRVTGRVVDAKDRPIPDAEVRAWDIDGRAWSGSSSFQTDEDGRFEIDDLRSDRPVWIVARAEGYEPRGRKLTPSRDTGNVVLRLGGGGVLEGTVTDHSGRPRRGLAVYLLRKGQPIPELGAPLGVAAFTQFLTQTTVTDDLGHYCFADVPVQVDYEVATQVSAAYEARADPVRFEKAAERITRDIRFPGAAALRLTLAYDDGEKITKAQVNLRNARGTYDAQPMTGEDGVWTFPQLSPGTYTVLMFIHQGPFTKQEITLGPLQQVERELIVPRGAEVTGVVVGEGGEPVAGVRAVWIGGSETVGAKADERGHFTIMGITGGRGRLTVRWDGWLGSGGPPLVDVVIEDVKPGGEPLRIVMKKRGTVTGRFPGIPEGTRIDATVYSASITGGGNVILGPDGRFEDGMPGAREPFLLVYERKGFAPLIVARKGLTPEKDIDLGDLRFDKGFTLDAVIENEKGEPLSGARVRLAEKWHDETTRTDARGRFTFARVPKRVLCLQVRASGYPIHLLCIDGQAFDAGERLVVRPGGHLNGRVLLPSGEPAVGVNVVIIPWTTSPYDKDHDKTRQHVETSAEGRFRAYLQPGAYRIDAYGPQSDRRGTSRGDVREGEATEVEIRLP